jgi:hypothetical protein
MQASMAARVSVAACCVPACAPACVSAAPSGAPFPWFAQAARIRVKSNVVVSIVINRIGGDAFFIIGLLLFEVYKMCLWITLRMMLAFF